jgi:hypothetical protein
MEPKTQPPNSLVSKQMSWKRGLVRLWIAVSVLWLIFPTYLLVNDLQIANFSFSVKMIDVAMDYEFSKIPAPKKHDIDEDVPDWATPEYWAKVAQSHEELAQASWKEEVKAAALQFIIFGAGPPIALLILGFVVRWIIAGFRQPMR